jgi:Putative transposase
MKAAAQSIIEIARDPRYVGATVGVLAVLHTWTQQLVYHPHVHCLVTGGGASDDGTTLASRAQRLFGSDPSRGQADER